MNTAISNERGRNFSKTPPKRIDRNKPNSIIKICPKASNYLELNRNKHYKKLIIIQIMLQIL